MKPPNDEWLGCFRVFRNKYLATLIATVILFTNIVSAQYQPINGNGFQWKAGKFDSMFMPPSRGAADTALSPLYKNALRAGALIYDSVNHVRWVWYNGRFNMESTGSAQIQSDWNQGSTGALDYIKNKPIFALVAFTGSFYNLSSIPTTISGYGITDAVPAVRTITINGISYDLSTNRSWVIGGGGIGSDPTAIHNLRQINDSTFGGHRLDGTEDSVTFPMLFAGKFVDSITRAPGSVNVYYWKGGVSHLAYTDSVGTGGGGGGGATHTNGYGLSGSPYDGSTARTWTVDTTSGSGLVSKARLNAAIPLTYFAYSDLILGTVNIDSIYAGGFLGRDAHHSGSNLYDHYWDSTDLYYNPRSTLPVNLDTSANYVMSWNKTTHKMMPSHWQVNGAGGGGTGTTFTSTLSNTTNIASSSFVDADYTVTGSIVRVTINGTLTPTAASTMSVLTMTLPTTALSGTVKVMGHGSVSTATAFDSGLVYKASTTTATFKFYATTTGGTDFSVSFDYVQ